MKFLSILILFSMIGCAPKKTQAPLVGLDKTLSNDISPVCAVLESGDEISILSINGMNWLTHSYLATSMDNWLEGFQDNRDLFKLEIKDKDQIENIKSHVLNLEYLDDDVDAEPLIDGRVMCEFHLNDESSIYMMVGQNGITQIGNCLYKSDWELVKLLYKNAPPEFKKMIDEVDKIIKVNKGERKI